MPVADAGRFLRTYFFGSFDARAADDRLYTPADAADLRPMVTGDDLISKVLETITLRRSVLVTGPRGCGKSHCSEEGIRRARDYGVIGGWRFLQGNREIPRDTLSEDALVIENGKPMPLPALVMRDYDIGGDQSAKKEQREALKKRQDAHKARRSEMRKQYPEWPALRTQEFTRKQAEKLWANDDWVVLYLDEINRFGDGFLDSLLSLTEEGKVVRRGEDYYVPMLVVATANPPGYDATAKKLSPPLQARIARSFRVAQPRFEDLTDIIIPKRVEDLVGVYGEDYRVPDDLGRLAAAATLCLWGDPGTDPARWPQGYYFLTRGTQQQLADVAARDRSVRRAMRTLSGLITFGPDARAVQDWIACAVGRAAGRRRPDAIEDELMGTAVEVLGHKVRETFNEGGEPSKVGLKEWCIAEIVRCVFTNPDIQDLFVMPTRKAAAKLAGSPDKARRSAAEAALSERLRQLEPDRQKVWASAFSRLEPPLTPAALEEWRVRAEDRGALTRDGRRFVDQAERDWVRGVLAEVAGDVGAADTVAGWGYDGGRQLDRALTDRPHLRLFRDALLTTQERNPAALSTNTRHKRWLDATQRLLVADRLTAEDADAWLARAWCELATADTGGLPAGPADALELFRSTFESIRRAAGRSGATRCDGLLGLVAAHERIKVEKAADRLAVPGGPDAAVLRTALLAVIGRQYEQLRRADADAAARAAAWVAALAKLPAGNGPFAPHCISEDALGKDGLFRSPAEQRFALAVVDAAAGSFPGESPDRERLTALRTELGGLRCSARGLLRGYFDAADGAATTALAVALDGLGGDAARVVFDGFAYTSPTTTRNLRALAGVARAAYGSDPAEGRAARTAAAVWNALSELGQPPAPLPAGGPIALTLAPQAVLDILLTVLRGLAEPPAEVKEVVDAFAALSVAHLERGGRLVHLSAPNAGQPVGWTTVAKWIGRLVGDLSTGYAGMSTRGVRWAGAVARLCDLKDIATNKILVELERAELVQNERFEYPVERHWLRSVLIQPPASRAQEYHDALSRIEVSHNWGARLPQAASDPQVADFLRGVSERYSDALLPGRFGPLTEAMLRFLDTLATVASSRPAMETVVAEVDSLAKPYRGRDILLAGLKAIRQPSVHVAPALRLLEQPGGK